MVVCKYFLDGNCMYGSRCRYEHIQNGRDFRYSDNYNYGENRYSGGRSVLRSNYVKANNNTQAAPVTDDTSRIVGIENVSEIYQSMLKEINAAEKGNQWPLSSFGPMKGLNIPGWIDHSPEEIRWELYMAYQNGTLDACKQAIDALYNDAKEKRAKIKIKENAYSIIQNMLGKENTNGVDMDQNSNAVPIINWNQQSVPATGFGNNTAVPFVSNNANSFFGKAMQNNAFPATGHSVSVFGTSQQASSFGNTSSNSFGAVNPSVNHSFRFHLDNNLSQPKSSIFPQNQFNMQDKIVNSTAAPSPTAANIARPDLQESTIFSLLPELSESDVKAFESNTFIFGSIPLKPPTKGLCRL